MHVLPLYATDNSMYEPDGRHFKVIVGKDYIDFLLDASDAGMIRVDLDSDDRLISSENRITVVEGFFKFLFLLKFI